MKNIFRSGFSLFGMIASMGAFSILAMAMGQLQMTFSKNVIENRREYSIDNMTATLNKLLSESAYCQQMLGGSPFDSSLAKIDINIVDPFGKHWGPGVAMGGGIILSDLFMDEFINLSSRIFKVNLNWVMGTESNTKKRVGEITLFVTTFANTGPTQIKSCTTKDLTIPTTSVKMVWKGPLEVEFVPYESIEVLALPINGAKYFYDLGVVGPLKWSPNCLNPNICLGLDSTSVWNSKTWYYVYAVPVPGFSYKFALIGSTNPPFPIGSGPSEYGIDSKHIGSFYSEAASVILPFLQEGKNIHYAKKYKEDESDCKAPSSVAHTLETCKKGAVPANIDFTSSDMFQGHPVAMTAPLTANSLHIQSIIKHSSVGSCGVVCKQLFATFLFYNSINFVLENLQTVPSDAEYISSQNFILPVFPNTPLMLDGTLGKLGIYVVHNSAIGGNPEEYPNQFDGQEIATLGFSDNINF